MRNGILGSMATLALGAGLAFGQYTPTLQQGLRLPVAGPGYAAAPVYPMSMPQQSAPVYPIPMATATQPGSMVPSTIQPMPGQFVQPMQVPVSAPAADESAPSAGPMAGQPLPSVPTDSDNEDWSSDSDNKHYGPGPVPYRVWGSAEYLLWWTKPGLTIPPLATTGPAGTGGILGSDGVLVTLGGQNLDYGQQSGIRATTGFWFDKEGHAGAELSGILLGKRALNGAMLSDVNGNPLIARPIINAQVNQEATTLSSTPGQLAGAVSFDSSSQFYSGETNFVGSLYRSKHFTADMLLGFRYAGLDEKLNVASTTTVLPGGIAGFNGNPVGPGSSVAIVDHFETRNDFYGGQVGGRTQLRWCRFYADFEGKLAVGNSHEVVNISGATTLTGAGVSPAVLPGGLLAVASNSGLTSRDEFTFVPEGSVKVGVHFTNYISAFVGYTFIYWFDVARPGDQIDRTVNPALVPSNLAFGSGVGPNRPAPSFNRTDFWAQGINLGVEVRY